MLEITIVYKCNAPLVDRKGPYVSIVKPISLFINSLDLKANTITKIIVRLSHTELIKVETEKRKIVPSQSYKFYVSTL